MQHSVFYYAIRDDEKEKKSNNDQASGLPVYEWRGKEEQVLSLPCLLSGHPEMDRLHVCLLPDKWSAPFTRLRLIKIKEKKWINVLHVIL